MKVFQYTCQGQRDYNQDFAAWSKINDNSAIFVLADGMGGYDAGDVAAKVCTEAIVEFVIEHHSSLSPDKLLHEAMSYANENLSIKKFAIGAKEMGTVIVIALVIKKTAYIAWLGDSRCYIMKEGRCRWHSEDDSLLNDLKRIRPVTEQEEDELSSVVTKSIMGTDPLDDFEVIRKALSSSDTIILCSDGLHKEIRVEGIPEDDDKLKEYLDINAPSFLDNCTVLKITGLV